MIYIRLNASELAIITGRNKYQSIDAIKEKILINYINIQTSINFIRFFNRIKFIEVCV